MQYRFAVNSGTLSKVTEMSFNKEPVLDDPVVNLVQRSVTDNLNHA